MSEDSWMIPVVKRVIKLLRKGYVPDYSATDGYGNIVAYTSPKAKKFSLPGAIFRAELDLNILPKRYNETTKFLNSFIRIDVAAFGRQHETAEPVIAMLERAIEQLENPPRAPNARPKPKVESW